MDDVLSHPAAWWLVVGIVLVIVEMLSGTFFFLFLGLGALLVAALTWLLGLGGIAQFVLFGVAAMVAAGAWMKVRPNPEDRIEQLAGARGLNNRLASYLGRESDLVEPIHNGEGRLRLDDTLWYVHGPDLPAGTRVRVVGAEGMKLRVEPVNHVTV